MRQKLIDIVLAVFGVLDDCVTVLKQMVYVFSLLIQPRRTKFQENSGRDVLVLANGPSVKEVDLDKVLASVDDVVCMNWFGLQEEKFKQVKPNYYCLVDAIFFGDAEVYSEKRDELFRVFSSIDWDITFICPCGMTLPIENPHFNYVWVNNNVFYGERLIKLAQFLYKRNLASLGMETVALCPLSYFISTKARRIYLLGIDMSEFKGYVINEKNEIYLETKHFYGTSRMRADGVGGFNKGEFYKLFASYQKMFEQFYYAQKYAQAQGVEVRNLSLESFVDVFEKDATFQKERS